MCQISSTRALDWCFSIWFNLDPCTPLVCGTGVQRGGKGQQIYLHMAWAVFFQHFASFISTVNRMQMSLPKICVFSAAF